MTLAEKIAVLRGERKLSQGDLAEKLDVSRQSVSKWETGQAVPELDKIIKLADLFGVTVDELVRDGDMPETKDAPKTETPPTAEPKIVYVERRLAKTQVAGVVLLVLGLLSVILGAAISGNSGSYMALVGAGMVVLGLPFLLARKHPFLAAGWVVVTVSCLILNPNTSICPWGLLGGLSHLRAYLTVPAAHYSTLLFGAIVGIIRGMLVLILLAFTGWLCWKKWNAGKRPKPETDG